MIYNISNYNLLNETPLYQGDKFLFPIKDDEVSYILNKAWCTPFESRLGRSYKENSIFDYLCELGYCKGTFWDYCKDLYGYAPIRPRNEIEVVWPDFKENHFEDVKPVIIDIYNKLSDKIKPVKKIEITPIEGILWLQ